MKFYWRHARESLLTDNALRMFQLLATHKGKKFDDVKYKIDSDYQTAVGRSSDNARNGGLIQSWVQAFREAGWATINTSGIIEITPAGEQALLLLSKTPDFIKAAPYFILQLLARHQLNNPARPSSARNPEYDKLLKDSTVFPYWTLLKIIRACDNFITASELKRFVFQIHKQDEIAPTIEQISAYRTDIALGKGEEELDKLYPVALEGSIGEPKYLMGRLGTQVGKIPPVLEKEGSSTWRLNRYYTSVVDQILSDEPIYKDYLSEDTWIKDYGSLVDIEESSDNKELSTEPLEPIVSEIEDTDEYYLEVKEIVDAGHAGVLFSGPPGTSKSWYARQIAALLVDGDPTRINFVQFHPSMAYDDFIEGYVPGSEENKGSFEIKKKTFLKLCVKAKEVQPSLCVIVIDEINRGDTSRIFGELLTYIEASYREVNFTATYSGSLISIPKNLFIIGTFNPFDKSIIELDDAMDRRFERLAFEPSPKLLAHLLKSKGVKQEMIEKAMKFFIDVNKWTKHGVGHTLFSSISDDASLKRLWNRKLKFIFEKSFRFDEESFNKTKEAYSLLFSDPSNTGI